MRENNVRFSKQIQIQIDMNKVRVKNPHDRQGVTVYEISGYDKMGFFESKIKRYRDFSSLHEMLLSNYQGLFIPILPPKKTLGNKETKFLEERRF